MKIDALFNQIQTWQGSTPWGDVLDAGTGKHSMQWITGLPIRSLTAITASSHSSQQLQVQFENKLKDKGSIIQGNWLNQYLLQNKQFDTVIADYLLGAIEGFSPYSQEKLFDRIHRHCRGRIYIVGQEPWSTNPDSKGGELVLQICKLRDACILLAGHNCYREYPKQWVLENLERNQYNIKKHRSIPIVIDKNFLFRQLDVCHRKIKFFNGKSIAYEMSKYIDSLKIHTLEFIAKNGSFLFGSDYVIMAEPNGIEK